MSLGKKSTAKDVIDAFKPDLKGKTAVVTGGNSGIGTETVKALASAGCRVILCSRSVKAGEDAVETHVKKADDKVKGGNYAVPDADIKVMQLDLADLRNVEQFAKELESEKSIDYLVLNAGVMMGPKGHTKDGFERQIGTNHFGHFHLTDLLLPRMKLQDTPSRVVVVSSNAHRMGKIDLHDLHYDKGRSYWEWLAYCQSKLANVLFTKELEKRLEGTKITATCLHPGVIATPLWRESWSCIRSMFLPFIKDKTVLQGAATTIYGCLEDPAKVSGQFLDDCKPVKPSKKALDADMARGLWEETSRQIKEKIASR